MTRRKVPYGTTAQLTTNTLQEREIAYDTTLQRFRMGNGVATAGEVVALQDDIDALESNGAGSDISVTATSSTTARTLANRFADTLNVLDWGVVADGTTDNTTALAAIVTYLNTLSAGNLPEVVFPKGIYSYVTSPNWAITGLRVRFEGDVRLRCTGTGDCFIIDAGASGYCWDVGFYGWPKIEGAATTNDGVYMRGILRSVVQFNVRGCGAKAFNIEFCVLVKFDHPIVSNNEQSPGGFYGATPTHGMYFTRRGSGSDHSGHNIIINPILEGVPIGGYEDYCVGNTWHGGALEGCTNTGFVATANSREVEMFGVDFEVNTTMDMDLSCDGAEFYGLHLEDLITIRSGASHNKFFGGDFEVITVASGATYNKFVKCGYNRYGSGAFNDSGTGTEYDLWNITAGTRILSDISDTAYDASSWNGVTAVAPSKNAVRDKIEAMLATTAVEARAMTSATLALTPASLASIGVLTGLISGLALANNGSDATNDIDFAAGYAADSTGAEIISCSALTKRLDASWAAGTNQGGLDTGSIANTTYHCFAIKKDSDGTGDFLFSTSATSPTMPSGYTKFRRVGSIIRASGAIVAFVQNGDYFAIAPTFEFSGGIGGPASARTNYTLTRVPAGLIVGADLTVTVKDSTPAAETYVGVTWPTQAAFTPSVAQHSSMIAAAGAGNPQVGSSRAIVRTNTSAQVAVEIVGSTADHTLYGCTHGWVDARGRA